MEAKVVAVVGSSFGDEGKAKIVDYLSKDFDYVVRYQGGDNAGHSVVFDGKSYVFKLIPSGIFRSKSIIAHGAVLNIENLVKEIEELKDIVDFQNRLFISNNVHIICDWNIQFDKMIEEVRSSAKIGTTGKGIGPTYAFKALRLGLRSRDLLDLDSLKEKIKLNLSICNPLFEKFNLPTFSLEECWNKYKNLSLQLQPYLCDTSSLLQKIISTGEKILFEGSQGLLLDIDMGTYPFVTSSSIIGSLSSGTGVPFFNTNLVVLGIVKAYCTRVGNGNFVTELVDEELSDFIREKGKEYGSVTGRKRRIGWLDLVALKYSCLFSGINSIALTLVDVLDSLDEVKVCIDYVDKNGNSCAWTPDNLCVTPVYKTFKGWKEDYKKIKNFSDFSKEFKDYVLFIEEYLKVKVVLISFGPNRKETLELWNTN